MRARRPGARAERALRGPLPPEPLGHSRPQTFRTAFTPVPSSCPAMRRMFAIPFIAALIGAGIVVAVLAAAGDLGAKRTVTTVEAPTPERGPHQRIQPSRRPDAAPGLHRKTPPASPSSPRRSCRTTNRRSASANRSAKEPPRGSGIVIDSNGTILTNYHVIENAIKVNVSFEKGKTVEAQVVGKDPSNDLAVLRIHPDGLTLHPVHARRLEQGPGRRPGLRDRQPVRPAAHADDRCRLGAPAPAESAERLHDLQRHPDRRPDQPRQLGRPAARLAGPRDRHQLADRDRRRRATAASASASPCRSTPPSPSSANSRRAAPSAAPATSGVTSITIDGSLSGLNLPTDKRRARRERAEGLARRQGRHQGRRQRPARRAAGRGRRRHHQVRRRQGHRRLRRPRDRRSARRNRARHVSVEAAAPQRPRRLGKQDRHRHARQASGDRAERVARTRRLSHSREA